MPPSRPRNACTVARTACQRIENGSPNRYRVIVHRLAVSSIDETYPEKELRARQWFKVSDAANVLGHEDLLAVLRNLGRPGAAVPSEAVTIFC